jgi:GYF domain 2
LGYYIYRSGQQSGPFSLADLQNMLATGQLSAQDYARTEDSASWVFVSQLLDTSAIPPPVPATPAYGAPGSLTGAPPVSGSLYPTPPNFHWVFVLLLTLVTCGLFAWVWLFVEASFVKRIDRGSNAILYYAIAVITTLGGGFYAGFTHSQGIQGLASIAGAVLAITGHYSIKGSLEAHYNREEPIGLRLSGVMVFFFNVLYFQYHFSEIARWKQRGMIA